MFKLLKYLRPYKGRAIFMIFLLFAGVGNIIYSHADSSNRKQGHCHWKCK